MTRSIEDRLRAHYADRTAREALPGPETDVALRAVLGSAEGGVAGHGGEGGNGGGAGAPRVVRLTPLPLPRGRSLWLAVAAVCAVVAGAAGALAFGGGSDGSNVSTDDRPVSTTEPDRPPAPAVPPTTVPDATPDTTTAAPDRPPSNSAPTGPIVSAEGVLGSWSGSAWVPWEPRAVPPIGDEYQVVRLDEPITTTVGRAGVDCAPTGLPTIDVGLRLDGDTLAPLPIAVAGVPDPRPRPVEVLDPSARVYRDAASAVVADLGIDDPAPQVRQVVRGDLDGDGAAEVVVVAERITDPAAWYAAEGDYAVVFMRRVAGGDFVTSVVASSIPHPEPASTPNAEVYRVAAMADLNGDGRMEVVLDGDYYEGSWTVVHELRPDGSVPEVLSAGCGA